MNILEKLMKKRGLDPAKLDDEELKQYKEWRAILTPDPITVDKIKEFAQRQVDVIEAQWANLDNQAIKNERLVLMHTMWRKLIAIIDAPEVEREALERHLEQLLDSNTEKAI